MAINILRRSLLYAQKLHRGETMQNTDKPYITYPILVSELVSMVYPEDENLIAAGYLVGAVQKSDKNNFKDNFRQDFNYDIVNLLYDVTFRPRLATSNRHKVLKLCMELAQLSLERTTV